MGVPPSGSGHQPDGLSPFGSSQSGVPNAGHTPLPWAFGAPVGQTGPTTPSFKPFCGGGDWPYAQVTRGLDTIAIFPAPDDGGSFGCGKPISAQAEANAAFIVRACNSHYDLLEALELASNALSVCVESGGYYVGEGIFEKINAAISRAHGAEQGRGE
jgi:hypothetical protein